MTLSDAVTLTYAVMGQDMSDPALNAVIAELETYPLPSVLEALARCRRELRRLSLVDILDRLPDGYPGVEEAWAMIAPTLSNEGCSIVWTDEMREAYGMASRLADDPVAARLAFKETYTTLIARARAAHQPVTWSASLGWDKTQREQAILEALQKHRITADYARRLLPYDKAPDPQVLAMIEQAASRLPKVV